MTSAVRTYLHHPLRHFRPEFRRLPNEVEDEELSWDTNYCTQGASFSFWLVGGLALAFMVSTFVVLFEIFNVGNGTAPTTIQTGVMIGLSVVFGLGAGIPAGKRLRYPREYYWGLKAILPDAGQNELRVHLVSRTVPSLDTDHRGWLVTELAPNGRVLESRECESFPAREVEDWAMGRNMDPLQATLWASALQDTFKARWTPRVARRFGEYPSS